MNNSVTEIDSENHVPGYNVKAITKAACLENGMQTYTCKCSDMYKEIPALGHDYQNKAAKLTKYVMISKNNSNFVNCVII